jgi:hypothetical protein
MRSLKLGLAATAAMCVLSASAAQAGGNCIRVGAIGDGLTHDLAVIMSTHGLANIIDSKGRTGHGAVHTTCSPGSVLTECRSTQMACK